MLKYDGPAPDGVDEETGAVRAEGVNSIDMRRGAKKAGGAIREGGAARAGGDSDDEVDAYLEGYEAPTADDA